MKTKNRVAIVTGGGHRLGRQIALALGRNGFSVVVNYHSSKEGATSTVKELKKMGVTAISIEADISKSREVNRMVSKTISTFHKVDLLVNNSAIFIHSPLAETSEKIWNNTININLKGIFLCSQAVSKYMLKQKKGKIINIASLGGIQAWTQHVPYSVSKAGVIMLTKVLAKSLAPNILVNAIAPGTIEIAGEEDPASVKLPTKQIPLKRYGKPTDITDMMVFLATKAEYITGQVFVIDGGRSIQ